jgi:hypothetical protein
VSVQYWRLLKLGHRKIQIRTKASELGHYLNGEGFPPPIGVPIRDVFAYSETAFERLRAKWKRGAQISDEEWGEVAN